MPDSDRGPEERGHGVPAGGEEAGPGFEHEPVLLREALEHLEPERGGWFLDGTVGGGGHAIRILEASEDVRLLGLDRDPAALEAARARLMAYADRARLHRSDFAEAPERVREVIGAGTTPGEPPGEAGPEVTTGAEAGVLAGALLDLGVSSHQIDVRERGFSFRPGTPLNMRMGGTTDGRRPASSLLNEAAEEELGRIFREYGEERRWRALAREVVRRRGERPFRTSDDLREAIEAVLGRVTNQDLARLFQALRIAVNEELDALERALPGIRETLAPGGRFVVIAYHSLEDRIVKNAFRDWSRDCVCPPGLPVCRCRGRALGRRLTTKPVRPTEAEVARNPRSRSARLRAWERA